MGICDFAIPDYSISRKSCIKKAANNNGTLFERNFGRYAHYQKDQASEFFRKNHSKTRFIFLVMMKNQIPHRIS